MKLQQLSLRHLFWLVLVVCLLCGVASAQGQEGQSTPSKRDKKFALALGMDIPVITSAKQLDEYVGRVVALRGVTSKGNKIPYMLGVQIDCPDSLRGKEVYALGILKKFEEKEVIPLTQNNGPGVKYVLYSDLRGEMAEVRELPK